MRFRPGSIDDIAAMHRVRLAVRENVLSRPDLVTSEHYRRLIEGSGKAFVCEDGGVVVGFSVVDGASNNVWALFVDPDYERRGIGRELLDLAVGWLKAHGAGTAWLTTQVGSRAEGFYASAGWRRAGVEANGEIRFEWDL